MKKIALLLALSVLPSMAIAELTAIEATRCVAMKKFADAATHGKRNGVSQDALYSMIANKVSGEETRVLAYMATDMVFDGYTSPNVRVVCINAFKG